MRVLLSTYDSRGGVEPPVGLAVRLRALGAEVRVCAPPDCAERLAEVGVPLMPVGPPVRPLVHGATPPSAADVPRLAAELIAAQFGRRWPRRCCSTRSAGKGRQCPREPRGTVEPGTPRTRESANPGDLDRQRPRGDVRRNVARHGHRVRHAGPGALLLPMVASDLRSELMP